HAPVLVLIYGDKNLFTSTTDCSMAALNLMLSAWDRGIGSCWIGFSYGICNSPEFKEEFHLPENHQLVAPIILGYPQEPIPQGDRKEVPLLYWMK
ncbi:MAG: nitroreductase family protein, partial [Atribacterota bacterium]